jgi:hypothetical protein
LPANLVDGLEAALDNLQESVGALEPHPGPIVGHGQPRRNHAPAPTRCPGTRWGNSPPALGRSRAARHLAGVEALSPPR